MSGAAHRVSAPAPPVALTPLVWPGAPGDRRAPVRIFLGSEPAQHRAERVFCYALGQVRDPARRYELYRMSCLPGFDTRTWRTGFTNYRFAIPALAGGAGTALYNDVDQVYTQDPGALFDTDLGPHGYRALSVQDTAVMLLDCARMAPVWTWEAARAGDKKALLDAAAPLWGPLDARWHARDGEYRHGRSALLHYTALHTQPWRPTPAQYSYHPHPAAELWLDLEHRADVHGYRPYSAADPSPDFPAACARLLTATPAPDFPSAGARALAARVGAAHALVLGPPVLAPWPGLTPDVIGPGALRETGPGADVVAGAALHVLPADDLGWVIEALFARAGRAVVLHADLRECAAPADGAAFWRAAARRAGARHPALCWRLELTGADGRTQAWEADFAARGAPPRVWLLAGAHAGDNAQLETLADALGWPYTRHALRFRPGLYRLPGWLPGVGALGLAGARPPLRPPWPDLVLAAGRRSAPLARRLRRRGARVVMIGRPRAPLRAFDAVLSTPQYGLPLRDNVIALPGPLHASAAAPEDARVQAARAALAGLPRPWTLVLVGGPSASYRFGADHAAALARAVNAALASRGGGVLVCTSPRTPAHAADVLAQTLTVPARVHRFVAGAPDNPYRAWLALADRCVVTGESASLLADAVATGKPVAVWPLTQRRTPWRRLARALAVRTGWLDRGAGSRGTPRQQDWRGRAFDALVAGGVLTRTRDLAAVHTALGVQALPDGLDTPPWPGAAALDGARARAVARVRELLTAEHPA